MMNLRGGKIPEHPLQPLRGPESEERPGNPPACKKEKEGYHARKNNDPYDLSAQWHHQMASTFV